MLTRNIAEPEIRQARFWLTMQNPELPTRPDALFLGLITKICRGFRPPRGDTRCSSDQRGYPKVRLTDAGEGTSVLEGILTSRIPPEVGRKAVGTMAWLSRRQRRLASETASANTLIAADSRFTKGAGSEIVSDVRFGSWAAVRQRAHLLQHCLSKQTLYWWGSSVPFPDLRGRSGSGPQRRELPFDRLEQRLCLLLRACGRVPEQARPLGTPRAAFLA